MTPEKWLSIALRKKRWYTEVSKCGVGGCAKGCAFATVLKVDVSATGHECRFGFSFKNLSPMIASERGSLSESTYYLVVVTVVTFQDLSWSCEVFTVGIRLARRRTNQHSRGFHGKMGRSKSYTALSSSREPFIPHSKMIFIKCLINVIF